MSFAINPNIFHIYFEIRNGSKYYDNVLSLIIYTIYEEMSETYNISRFIEIYNNYRDEYCKMKKNSP